MDYIKPLYKVKYVEIMTQLTQLKIDGHNCEIIIQKLKEHNLNNSRYAQTVLMVKKENTCDNF